MNLAIVANITGPGDYNFKDFLEDGEIGTNIDVAERIGPDPNFTHYMNYNVGPNPATLHVISLTDNPIKATFSGQLYPEEGNEVVTITNGFLDTELSTDTY